MEKKEFVHYSVMLTETIEALKIRPDGIYLDGTLGGGGHSFEIAKRLTTGHLYGIDQDEAAIEAAAQRLKPYLEKADPNKSGSTEKCTDVSENDGRVTILRGNYCDARIMLAQYHVEKVDGILLDLGVSSYQLDTEERGFSYRFDAPLDMRMDRRRSLTAKQIVNEYSEADLFRIIRDYGEERFAKNIAKHIVQERQKKPINTTFELNDIIKAAIPAKLRQDGHPSKQTFQAIRIECNGELEVLKNSLDSFVDMLNPGGRMCVITFHSLEDRIVKTIFKTSENPCTCPPNFPVCVCNKRSKGRVITTKPIVAGEEELQKNPRSKSAKLRVFEKT